LIAKSRVKVYRYNPDRDSTYRFDDFDVPLTEGMTVLDALNYIYENYDSSLSYRWNCRAGQCGSCTVMVSGKPAAACRSQMPRDGEVSIAPLLQFPVIKDLVVDLRQGISRLERTRPYVQRGKIPERPERLSQDDIEPMKELRKCLECWGCISACPVVAAAWHEFSGPTIMTKLARLALDRRDIEERVKVAFTDGVYSCTTCKTCVEVCPKSIDIPGKAIEKLRAYAVRTGLGPLEGQMAFLNSIANTGKSVDRTSTPLLETVPERIDVLNPVDRVAFFTGCLMDYRLQDTGRSIINTLRRNAVEVFVPKNQSCCASPAFRTGVTDLAEKQVKSNVEIFESLGVDKVVVGCAGCGMTLRTNFEETMRRARDEGLRFRVYDFTEYLVDELGIERLDRSGLKPVNKTFTYHAPCHLMRGQGVKDQPIKLLEKVPGLRYVQMQEYDRCCGAGGGVRTGKRPLSMMLARRKVELIRDSGAESCVTECPFCSIQIKDAAQQLGVNIEVVNVADLLAESYQ